MTIASNSYADKVFAEHPAGLWSLDEPVHYGDMMHEFYRDMQTTWTITGGTAETFTGTLPLPIFEGSVINQIKTNNLSGSTYATVSMYPALELLSSYLDFDLGSFTLATYIYPYSKTLTVTMGYQYKLNNVWHDPIYTQFSITQTEQWSFISETFDIPNNGFTDIRFGINVTYHGPTTDYKFLVHGMSLGQQTEQFNVESLGNVPESLIYQQQYQGLPRIPVPTQTYGIKAKSYGLKTVSGYYLSKPSNAFSLCSTNSDIPMVFGAANSTKITPNEGGLPSLIIPGMNFMSQDGKYSDTTFETWIKIQSTATVPTRILGPITSDDGLYVNDSFLTLKINGYSGSYYVGEWDRPMLLAIRLSEESASVVINGEEVIGFTMLSENVTYPERYEQVGEHLFDNNWIGFYASEDVPQINVDSIAVYPYIVPTIVQKRRWIYGQGVEAPENIVGAAIGSNVAIDYTVANYAKNYSYPDLGRFQHGINENLLIEDNSIALPQYNLPEISFNNKSLAEWYDVVPDIDDTYGDAISLKPNSGWDSTDGYLLFSNLNTISQDMKAFYGIFESKPDDISKQILFYIENELTRDALEVSLQGTTIAYTLKTLNMSGEIDDQIIYSDSYHTPGDFLVAGINIDVFVSSFGGKASSLFGSKQNLKFYVGGTRQFSSTFSGKIYRVGFCTARNLQKISFAYTSQGIANGYNSLDTVSDFVRDAGDKNFTNTDQFFDNDGVQYWPTTDDAGSEYFGNEDTSFEQVYDGGHVYSILIDSLLQHVASYTLVPKTFLGTFMLDIAVNGYWQDYIPLSYFAKYVKDGTVDSNGNDNTYLDVDFIQFNISYPEIKKFINAKYDTSKSIVKTYVSFQYLQNNSSINISSLFTTKPAPQTGVIIPGSDWDAIQTTKYEVVNDVVIYPPDGIDFGMLAMVVHIEIISNSGRENPVKIRSLELSSQALNAFVPNGIGTKHGALIYPYRKSAEYYDYKGRNPFSIYKGNTPYLYLTSHSGLRLRELEGSNVLRGFSMPINKTKTGYYKVGALQLNARFDGETFPDYVEEMFEVEAVGPETAEYIKFYVQRVDSLGKRARIYAVDAITGLAKAGVTFYINGSKVAQAVVNINSWSIIGVSFASPLDFSSNVGAIRVTNKVLFNNVSHYQITAADEASKTVYRKWAGVLSINDSIVDWDYWKIGDPGADPVIPGSKWKEVLFVNTGDSGQPVDGSTIYKKFTGTDRLVVDYIADTGVDLRIKNYEYMFYDDIKWYSNITKPV